MSTTKITELRLRMAQAYLRRTVALINGPGSQKQIQEWEREKVERTLDLMFAQRNAQLLNQ